LWNLPPAILGTRFIRLEFKIQLPPKGAGDLPFIRIRVWPTRRSRPDRTTSKWSLSFAAGRRLPEGPPRARPVQSLRRSKRVEQTLRRLVADFGDFWRI